MFTGLVEETGELLALERSAAGARLTLRAPTITRDMRLGDSVAVNGCCLTVTAHEGGMLAFDLLDESLARTNLGALAPGAPVNLERALSAQARLGGHFVQGHIDTTSRVLAFEQVKADYRLEIELPREYARYVAFKGSIAIDGISLTVAEVRDESFSVWIIPHTRAVTNLRAKQAGDLVNLEFDLLAKYVERIVSARS
jgi:riboflavin synthase